MEDWGKCKPNVIMHGRERREGENHQRVIVKRSGCFNQHMRSVSLITTKRSLADAESCVVSSSITEVSCDSFCKVLPFGF